MFNRRDISTVRRAAVAGAFYPEDASTLSRDVRRYLDDGDTRLDAMGLTAAAVSRMAEPPRMFIAPHAGYVYSGPIAGTAYACLRRAVDAWRARHPHASPPIERVALLGPSHRVAISGLATSSASDFDTPVGPIPLDRDAIDELLALPHVHVNDASHAAEHSLEVHLPLLIEALTAQDDGSDRFEPFGVTFKLIPLTLGDVSADAIVEVFEKLWAMPGTLIVVSSDLSHYLRYDEAMRIDTSTSRAIESLRPDLIGRDQACGQPAVQAACILARRHGLKAITLDQRNSADTGGARLGAEGRQQVVGYGAYVFVPETELATAGQHDGGEQEVSHDKSEPPNDRLDQEARRMILRVAYESIANGLREHRPLATNPDKAPPALANHGACFVTLKRQGQLRGCIGSLEPRRALIEDVAENAFAAAFRDPRFEPLRIDELADLDIHVSVLTPATPLRFIDERDALAQLRPGIDGVVLEDTSLKRRGTFLPAVWESLPEPTQFWQQLKRKAGLPVDHWSDTMRVSVYQAIDVHA